MAAEPAAPQCVVETSLYGDDLPALERFYTTVLGLTLWDKDPDRHLFFQVGPANMLLVFMPETTLHHGVFPAHGARGAGHVALGIPVDQLEAWRTRLHNSGVPIEKEMTWPKGGHSLYFRDPAGNSVELITPGVWGLSAGW